VSFPASSRGDAPNGSIVHWNLAGWARNAGDSAVARRLARDALATDPPPLAVTANEVCDAQYDALLELLAPAGFSGAAAWSVPDFGETGCRSYGNVVFWRGGDGGVERYTYPNELQADGAATREKRNVLLAASATGAFRVATTHPSPRLEVAEGQVRALTEWLDERSAGPPILLAGDLNLTPRRHALDELYRTHQEAERLPRWLPRPTHNSLRKLDYVFVPRDRLRISGYTLRFRCALSDHALVRARITALTSAHGATIRRPRRASRTT
jgi:endonuclease/exonuclease/phosphatase family metal-dependent hydrolase